MGDHTILLESWLIVAMLCGFVSAAIGMGKGIAGPGFLYGLFLGPIGILLASVAPDERISCPVCREPIRASAAVCPKCRTSMNKLRYDVAPRENPAVRREVIQRSPPKIIPKAVRVAAPTPRVAAKVPRVVANVTRFLMGKPPKVVPKVQQVIEKAPRFLICKPGEEVRGPYDLAQIQALMECGAITTKTQFCREGETVWNDSLTV